MRQPEMAEIDSIWQDLVDERLSREEVHSWSAKWVESDATQLTNGVVSLGLHYLHGADLVQVDGTAKRLQHGTDGVSPYHCSIAELADQLAAWRQDVIQYEQDSHLWIKRRREQALREVRRMNGAEAAQNFANTMVARGLIDQEVAQRIVAQNIR